MENYKIKRNPKPLTDEQINRHKDFEKLLVNQQKLHRYKDATKPLYKNWRFMGLVLLISVITLVILLEPEHDTSAIAAQDAIPVAKGDSGLPVVIKENAVANADRPLPRETKSTDVEKQAKQTPSVVYETFQLNAEKGAVVYTNSAIRLLIPAKAFKDLNGDETKSDVILKFRELSPSEKILLKELPNATLSTFEVLAFELSSNKPLALASPLVLETIRPIHENTITSSKYSEEQWETADKAKTVYRFSVQSNDAQFPELAHLRTLIWELPGESGQPSDFNYIFNRSWKSFSYKTTDKKELAVKNSGSSYKGVPDIAPILGDKRADQELKEAFYITYNFATGKNTDLQMQQTALEKIQQWKNSTQGKQYQEWLNSDLGKKQFLNTYKVSKINVKSTGIYCLIQASTTAAPIHTSNRTLVLEKYPERVQQHNTDTEQY